MANKPVDGLPGLSPRVSEVNLHHCLFPSLLAPCVEHGVEFPDFCCSVLVGFSNGLVMKQLVTLAVPAGLLVLSAVPGDVNLRSIEKQLFKLHQCWLLLVVGEPQQLLLLLFEGLSICCMKVPSPTSFSSVGWIRDGVVISDGRCLDHGK